MMNTEKEEKYGFRLKAEEREQKVLKFTLMCV